MERGDEFSLIIERILILIRNVLYVPANPDEFRPDNDASVHDQVRLLNFIYLNDKLKFIYDNRYYGHFINLAC